MSKIILSSVAPCPCPDTGYQPGSDVAYIDHLDGYPGEYGEFSFEADDITFDRGTSEDADIRIMLGLSTAPTGTLTAKYKFSSMIKVERSDPEYYRWKGYRLDCGNSKYTCIDETTADSVGNDAQLIPNPIELFRNDNGDLDLSCAQLIINQDMILPETIGANGNIFNGIIPNWMFIDQDVANAEPTFNGIPVDGAFNAFIDDYGLIYSAAWKITGDLIDITWMIKDPRVPGQPDAGRIVRTGNKIRVWRTGVVTIIRQQLKVVQGGYVIMAQGTHQEIDEFQTTFGCGDTTVKIDPFVYHFDNMVSDAIEFSSGSGVILSDPADPEFIWFPELTTNSNGDGFILPGAQLVPLTQLPNPS